MSFVPGISSRSNPPSVCTLVRKRQLSECGSLLFRRQISKFLQGNKELLMDQEIISPHQNTISTLAVDTILGRFVLAGSADATISIYDLSHWGSEGFIRKLTHSSSFTRYRPVARSLKVPVGIQSDNERALLNIPSGHSAAVTHVQWYPVDTGVFVSTATDGCLLLWDTNRMEPVLKVTPFLESLEWRDEGGSMMWSSAHWQPRGDHSLVATGSWFDSSLRLVDIRSGASSHQLIGHSEGITAVQWSPTNPCIVASGSKDQSIRLWDIRKSGSGACISILGRDRMIFDDLPDPPYQGDYSHLRTYAAAVERRRKRKRHGGLRSEENALATTRTAPNNFNHIQRQRIISHHSHVAGISFLPGGQRLASVGGKDGEVLLWDLRHGPTLLDRRFVSPGGKAAATKNQRRTALCTDADEGILWVGHDHDLMGFSFDGGTPKHILRGHLGCITSLDRIQPEMTLLSGSTDGMILSWGKPKGSLFVSGRAIVKEDRDTW